MIHAGSSVEEDVKLCVGFIFRPYVIRHFYVCLAVSDLSNFAVGNCSYSDKTTVEELVLRHDCVTCSKVVETM